MCYSLNSMSFLNYDASLTTVITWGSDSGIYNLFIGDANFPVCHH